MARIQLKGTRVNLRTITKRDAESIYQYACDEAISEYTFIPRPYRLANALKFIRYSQAELRKGLAVNLGIELLESGQVIGMIGVEGISKVHKRGELGYWLARPFWGKGLASEAIRLMLGYCFDELKMERVFARVMHPNVASARLLERLGFTLEGCQRRHLFQRGRWMDLQLFGLLRHEFHPESR